MISKKYFMLCGSIRKEELGTLNGNYLANIKFDGERIIAIKKGKDVFLVNRRGREKSHIYPEIARELKRSEKDFILDGEIITKNGLFNSLQHRSNLSDIQKIKWAEKDYPINYIVFDVISINKEDLRFKPLKERIERWKDISFNKPIDFKVIMCDYGKIEDVLEYSERTEQEGIIIKNMDSLYEHKRSNDWLKLKFFKETNLMVIQYVENNKGIRVEDKDGNAVQISGEQHIEVKNKIDTNSFCEITIQYLTQSEETKRYRFPSFREIKK